MRTVVNVWTDKYAKELKYVYGYQETFSTPNNETATIIIYEQGKGKWYMAEASTGMPLHTGSFKTKKECHKFIWENLADIIKTLQDPAIDLIKGNYNWAVNQKEGIA